MGFIDIGTHIGADAGLVKERKSFVSDLRKTFEALNHLGLARLLSSKNGKVAVKKLTHSLVLIAREVGHATVLRALAVMNDLANKHAKYMAITEKNPGEFRLLAQDLKIAFADVEMKNRAVARRGVRNIAYLTSKNPRAVKQVASMGAWGILLAMAAAGVGVYFATKAFGDTNTAPLGASPNALLDFFVRLDAGTASAAEYNDAARLADSLRLPLTAQAIRQNQRLQGLPQGEVWPGTKSSVWQYVNSYVGQFKAETEISTSKNATENAKAQLLSYLVKYAHAKLQIPPGSSAPGLLDRGSAIAAAGVARLPLTAAAVASDSGLPSSEMWPGSGISVDLYVKTYLTRMGLIASPRPPGQGISTSSNPLTSAPPPPPPPTLHPIPTKIPINIFNPGAGINPNQGAGHF